MFLASDTRIVSTGDPLIQFPTDILLDKLNLFFLADNVFYDPEGLLHPGWYYAEILDSLVKELQERGMLEPLEYSDEISTTVRRSAGEDEADAEAAGLIKLIEGHIWCDDDDHNEGNYYGRVPRPCG